MILAVVAALATAACYAAASVLQQQSAAHAPPGRGLRIALIRHLMTRPGWLAGQALAAVGAGLNALALASGPLVVVQPLLVLGLVFALPASLLVHHRRPSVAEIGWALVLVGALAGFLVSAKPTGGSVHPDTVRLLAASVVTLVSVGALVSLARGPFNRHGAAMLGAASGALLGLAAALLKDTLGNARQGVWSVLSSWPLWLLLASGLAGFLLSQAAFQAGPLAASLPLLTIADPLVAVGVGMVAFGETIDTSPGALVVQLVCAALMVIASTALVRRSTRADPPRAPA